MIASESPPFTTAVIIGAGPIGLAAAAHLHARGESFLVLESAPGIAGSMREWSHVRLFTPWRFTIDPVAGQLLDSAGWKSPDPEALPFAHEVISEYLEPLAGLPEIAPSIRLAHTVTTITRASAGKLDEDREHDPFLIFATTADGSVHTFSAGAVIDASGNWKTPNPIGSNGLHIPGEREHAARIAYGPPDVLGRERDRYIGKRTLVVGSGHSALNALNDICALSLEEPSTRAHWVLRRDTSDAALAACDDDELTERTLLKRDIRSMVTNERIDVHSSTRLTRIESSGEGIVPFSGERELPVVDEIIVATGFRPDTSIERELRLDLHHTFECAHELARLINPNINACGTVPPHGIAQLAHPELDLLIIGAKSYGRAPTFLLFVGYEQVRSIVSAIVRDDDAFEIKLELPERGLCSACTAFLYERDAPYGCSCETDGDADDPDCCAEESEIEASAEVGAFTGVAKGTNQ